MQENTRSVIAVVFGGLLFGITPYVRATTGELPTVYGIKLGGPQALPNCKEKSVQNWAKGWLEYKEACYSVLIEGKSEWLKVTFPSDETPALASGGELGLTVRDEIVHSIHWGTKGVFDAQDEIIASLKKKFGAPTKTEKSIIQTQQGASYDGWKLRWDRPGYVVHYSTMNFARLPHIGNVTIRTKDEERRIEETSAAAKRPL